MKTMNSGTVQASTCLSEGGLGEKRRMVRDSIILLMDAYEKNFKKVFWVYAPHIWAVQAVYPLTRSMSLHKTGERELTVLQYVVLCELRARGFWMAARNAEEA